MTDQSTLPSALFAFAGRASGNAGTSPANVAQRLRECEKPPMILK